MKLILHVGMPKTGTSSIQDTFFRFQHPDFEYVDWQSVNHGSLFVLLFERNEKVADFRTFKMRGPDFARRIPEMRARWRGRLLKQLRQAHGKTLLFSAEVMSAIGFEAAHRNLRSFFEDRTEEIFIIGYARPPAGFMTSAFQQRLKRSCQTRLQFPHYRNRFSQIDRVYGRDRVHIREFSRARLLNGDVVQDFAQATGIPLPPPDRIARFNESLSLEATALLYVQRSFGSGFLQGFNHAPRANNMFVNRLAGIGSSKLVFSNRLIAPALAEISEDIAWMEERLGHPFTRPEESTDGIDSLDDLVEIALQNHEAVIELLGEDEISAARAPTLENLVQALDALQVTCLEACRQ